jgi:hypothetical protein
MMESAAGHDSAWTSRVVPSRGGISHNPNKY